MVSDSFLIIIGLIYVSWFVQATYQLLTWTYWIQDKEYRWDRFRLLLAINNSDGLKELMVVYIFCKIVLLFTSIFVWQVYGFYLLTLLIFDLIVMLKVAKHLIRRPVFTTRAKWIVLTTGFVTCLIIFLTRGSLLYEFIAAEFSLLIVPVLVVIITGKSVENTKRNEMLKARKLLKASNPYVIGVTGSYGKTTTKDFIAQILASKYQVAKTTGSKNTGFGVYRDILAQVNKNIDYFIAEIGAYKIGEIAEIAKTIQPQIAVITGIEPQHIELFGSIKNIKKAKFELVEALQQNGTALFNFSNKHCVKLADHAKKVRPDVKVIGYGVDIHPSQVNVLSSHIVERADNILSSFAENHERKLVDEREEFPASEDFAPTKREEKIPLAIASGASLSVTYQSKNYQIKTNVTSENLIENLSCAILVGLLAGLDFKEIRQTCLHMILPEKTLNTIKLQKNTVVIDDTFNATPKGFDAAINYAESFVQANKIIITTGIIELGSASAKVHTTIAQKIAGKFSKVILRNDQFAQYFKTGLTSSTTQLQVITDITKLRTVFNTIVVQGDVLVLLEGKLPKILTDDLQKYINA